MKEKEWKIYTQHYRDMHASPFHEAICPHGNGHHKGVHGCDLVNGKPCCASAPKEIWDKVTED